MLTKLEIQETAEALVADGMGILAADESFGSIQKRFEPMSITSTEDNRRAYREMFFTTPGVEEFISGVILFDETLRQSSSEGEPFPKLLARKGIFPGIKVDRGTKPLPGFPGEKLTEGLDGLRERLVEYRELGARFAKWRAVYSITPSTPSRYAIQVNARSLALYARMCQEEGITPIVEPEILMDGMHNLSVCEEVTAAVLREVFSELAEAQVLLEGMLLKPNMIMPGVDFPKAPSVDEVAEGTLRTLRRSVPPAVTGIVFLSGGQSAEQATAHLNAMNAMGPHPWKLSFSYGRALQAPSLDTWRGKFENLREGQRLFYQRARLNSLAARGAYRSELEQEVTGGAGG
jgi:fructose-bisphosphate aldolase class I